MAIEKGNKKVINAWCWFDWANSVYPLVITSAIFPIYFATVTKTGDSEIINLFGINFRNSELYSYIVAVSFLMVALINPILSGIADYAGKKKFFMKIFSTLGAFGSMVLFLFTGLENLWVGIGGSIVASVGFAGSLVFYNAFLPEIAHEKDLDMVSAKGFTMGYIGSSLMLILCLIVIQNPETFGFDGPGLPTRLSFLAAGLWWMGFATITFRGLPSNVYGQEPVTRGLLVKGYEELLGVMRQLRSPEMKRIRWFLFAFFLYAFGYNTVIYLATIFGKKELGLETGQLIMTVLIIQFVAIAGSYLFAWLSGRYGNVKAIMVAVLIWALVCLSTWFVYSATDFYIVAFFVGTVMGGIQSLSRATYAKLLPETHDHASFYSFYELTEKVATAAGTFSFGLIIWLTGTMRASTIFLGLFFVAGFIVLYFVTKIPAPEREGSTLGRSR